ncbi:MAG: 1-acyl-sn-glycerol-3-phosphate acyltransferase [Desulfobacteraceae bacterium]|nr:MAG: 1-acyl-sn-glycerol-3-phosphate acyltransferase [Desulfobacteraceae bacterium]
MKKSFILICFNTIFYLLFILFSFVGIPLFSLIVAIQSVFISHRKAMGKFRRAISWYGLVIIKALPYPFVTVRYKDLDKTKIAGPFIFTCNHRSASDPFLMSCLPYEFVQVVNIWPFKLPVLGFMARSAGYLSVREMPFEAFSEKAEKLLKDGVSIVAFPEGTRSVDGSLGQFHGSIFRVALKTGYPVVPVCITGNERIPARGTLLLRPGTVKIHKLSPVTNYEYAGLTPYKLKNVVRQLIADEIEVMEGRGND